MAIDDRHGRRPTSLDSELLARIAAGDETAFAALCTRYTPRMYATALRITADATTAEEVVQDTCLAIWRSAWSFRAGGDAVVWLDAIAAHRAIDATRVKLHSERAREEPLASLAATPAGALHWQHADSVEHLADISHVVATLPAAQRQVIALHVYAGMPVATVARQLGAPLGTIKARVRLALMRLRREAEFAQEHTVTPADTTSRMPMSAAPMHYFPDGSVDWGSMWQSFCLLARAGGPPHRGTMLYAQEDADPARYRYRMVVNELRRGVTAVTGRDAAPADRGWIVLHYNSAAMAHLLADSIMQENVQARATAARLYMPAGEHYPLV